MGTIIIPFRSKSDATRLYSALNAERLAATIVSTPPKYGKSCGLSVITAAAFRERVVYIVKTLRLSSVIGIYNRG